MDNSQTTDTITLSSITDALDDALSNGAVGATNTYTLSPSITAPLTLGTTVTGINSMWTTNNTTSAPWLSVNPTNASTTIQLNGENADILVNGWSLVESIKRIEERLAITQTDPRLEEEWEQLKVLGEQYRQLEAKILEQAKMWKELKS